MVCGSAGHLWTDMCRVTSTRKTMATFPGTLECCSGLWLVKEGLERRYPRTPTREIRPTAEKGPPLVTSGLALSFVLDPGAV